MTAGAAGHDPRGIGPHQARSSAVRTVGGRDMEVHVSQERLNRVLADGFIDGLDALSTDEIRARRADAQAEEEAVSYVRRLLQGRLDILRAELIRRTDEGSAEAAGLLGRLATVLSDDAVVHRDQLGARATRLRVPEGIDGYTERLDAVLDASALEELEGRTVETLQAFIDRLTDHEHELSEIRQQLFVRIDALRSELASRYKDGRAVIGDLLAER